MIRVIIACKIRINCSNIGLDRFLKASSKAINTTEIKFKVKSRPGYDFSLTIHRSLEVFKNTVVSSIRGCNCRRLLVT